MTESRALWPTWPQTCDDATGSTVHFDGANCVVVGVDDQDIVDEVELLRLPGTPPSPYGGLDRLHRVFRCWCIELS